MSGPTKSVIAPTTSLGERQRQIESAVTSFPGYHEGIRQGYGVITEVHPESRFIKAVASNDSLFANGKWIPVIHTTQWISENIGTIRTGMAVLISYAGPDGGHANATIIGTEGEQFNENLSLNSFATGIWRIFQ